MFTLATVNVNGIRAAARRGLHPWLAGRSPDVLAVQEVRAPERILRDILGEGWHVVQAESTVPGRAAVAVASRVAPVAVRVGLGSGGAGRWAEADLALAGGAGARLLTVVSAYVPSGQAGTPRQDEKYRFLDAALARGAELAGDGRHVVVTGDLNIAHREADLWNGTANRTRSGFLPAERAWFDRLVSDLGWVDVGRSLAGEGPGPFTWWSWRGRAFDDDAGWRLDYQLATPGLAARAVEAAVDRAATSGQRWSDHAPVVVRYDLGLAG